MGSGARVCGSFEVPMERLEAVVGFAGVQGKEAQKTPQKVKTEGQTQG